MIARPNNWNEIKEPTERRTLDIVAGVAKVKQAVVKNSDWGAQLCILFDLSEGEYAGYYQQDFDAQKPNPGEEKRWKGVLRMWLPKEDGSEQDEWSKRSLKGMATAFEKSNPGYTWNWDERTLAGKYIGIIYRNEEWEYNGKTGWSKRPFRCTSIDKVREGAVKAPKDKPLKNKSTAPSYSGDYGTGYGDTYSTQGYGNFADEEDCLPFN